MITVILGNPYFCMGETGNEDRAQSAVAKCSCCKHPAEREDAPRLPDENEPDCLCRGAIIDGLRQVEPDDSAGLPVHWMTVEAEFTSQLSFVVVTTEPPHHFPPFSTGRDVCALTCTLLL